MCGIIAVVRRPSDRQPPELAGLVDTVIPSADPGGGGTPRQAGDGWDATRSRLDEAGKALDGVDRELHGAAGLACLLADPDGRARLDRLAAELERRVERLEAAIDAEAAAMPADALEAVNAALVGAKDGLWAIRRDRIASAAAVAALAGRHPGRAAMEAYGSIQIALAALDRLEVRGRDSAGLDVLVSGHGLDLEALDVAGLLAECVRDPLYTFGAVRAFGGPRAGARAHPLGQRRPDQLGQRPPARPGRGRRPYPAPVRRRGAQWRRRQLPGAGRQPRAAHPRRDHHRRQGDPGAA